MITNDRHPRATTDTGELQQRVDWQRTLQLNDGAQCAQIPAYRRLPRLAIDIETRKARAGYFRHPKLEATKTSRADGLHRHDDAAQGGF